MSQTRDHRVEGWIQEEEEAERTKDRRLVMANGPLARMKETQSH